MALIDRTRELSVLTGLLEDAQAGNSAAMVLRGEPGIGKTVLLEAVSGSADAQGMTTAHVSGIESEAPLGYAALHRLIRFFPGAVDRLPPPQRDALRTTFGLVFGPPPDRFLIGLGVLTLLANAEPPGLRRVAAAAVRPPPGGPRPARCRLRRIRWHRRRGLRRAGSDRARSHRRPCASQKPGNVPGADSEGDPGRQAGWSSRVTPTARPRRSCSSARPRSSTTG